MIVLVGAWGGVCWIEWLEGVFLGCFGGVAPFPRPVSDLEAEDGLIDEARDEAVLDLLLAQLGPRVTALDVPLDDLLCGGKERVVSVFERMVG